MKSMWTNKPDNTVFQEDDDGVRHTCHMMKIQPVPGLVIYIHQTLSQFGPADTLGMTTISAGKEGTPIYNRTTNSREFTEYSDSYFVNWTEIANELDSVVKLAEGKA